MERRAGGPTDERTDGPAYVAIDIETTRRPPSRAEFVRPSTTLAAGRRRDPVTDRPTETRWLM